MVSTPARAAKIVLADPENKPSLNEILHILLYFLRSSTIVEHNFEGNFLEITNTKEKLPETCDKSFDDNFDSGIDCEMRDIVRASCSNQIEKEVILQAACKNFKKPSTFVDNLESKNDCCNSMQSGCSKSLYPDIQVLARLENVRVQDLTSERDRTLFVDQVLGKSLDEGFDEGDKSVKFVIGEVTLIKPLFQKLINNFRKK